MEQNEKIEKPAWVESVERLPEIIRQQVGTTSAGIISSLVQLWFISRELFDDVLDEATNIVKEYEVATFKDENV